MATASLEEGSCLGVVRCCLAVQCPSTLVGETFATTQALCHLALHFSLLFSVFSSLIASSRFIKYALHSAIQAQTLTTPMYILLCAVTYGLYSSRSPPLSSRDNPLLFPSSSPLTANVCHWAILLGYLWVKEFSLVGTDPES